MASPEWIATIIGALLCLVISWFIVVVSRSQGVSFGKAGPAIGISGALILAGMALVGPRVSGLDSDSERSGVVRNYIAEAQLNNLKRRSLVVRTIREAGRRPDKNHVAYEFPNGKLAWISKSEYLKLKKGK